MVFVYNANSVADISGEESIHLQSLVTNITKVSMRKLTQSNEGSGMPGH